MDRRLQIVLLVLALIFQSVQVVAFVGLTEIPATHTTDSQSTTEMEPCHQSELAGVESSNQACDHCERQTPCVDGCATSCVSGPAAFISQTQDWLVPAAISSREQASTDNLSAGVQPPIYHPPIRP